MIGSGQYLRVQMWNGEEVIQDGTLFPGESINLQFSDGPQLVSHFALTRMTRAEAEALADELGVTKEL